MVSSQSIKGFKRNFNSFPDEGLAPSRRFRLCRLAKLHCQLHYATICCFNTEMGRLPSELRLRTLLRGHIKRLVQ